MTNEVLDGAARAVSEAFPSVPVYDEPVPQGLPTPALTVRAARTRQELFRGPRYERWDTIEVTVFPPEGEVKHFLNEAFDKLFFALEIIEADGAPLRGGNMEATTTEDGVGVFLVTYHYYIDRTGDKALMDALKETARARSMQ